MLRWYLLLATVCISILACGQKPQAELQKLHAELPDNAALKLQCWAIDKTSGETLAVDYDDQADLRLCAILQKDGHLGLDLRYRGAPTEVPQNVWATLSVRNKDGSVAQESVPLHYDELLDAHELYVSDGCVVGSFGGCKVQSPQKQQDLFAPLRGRGEGHQYPAFTLDLSLNQQSAPHTHSQTRSYSISIPPL